MVGYDTDYGFIYGPLEVQRVCSDEKKGWVMVQMIGKKRTITVYVTKSGKVRVFEAEGTVLNKRELK